MRNEQSQYNMRQKEKKNYGKNSKHFYRSENANERKKYAVKSCCLCRKKKEKIEMMEEKIDRSMLKLKHKNLESKEIQEKKSLST